MSSYVRKKAIRCQLDKKYVENCKNEWDWIDIDVICDKFNVKNEYDIEAPNFSIDNAKEQYFLDYMLFYEYDSTRGDCEFVRKLSEEEDIKYRKMFEDKFNIPIGELRLVDYCFWNACDEPMVWDIEEI